MWRLTSSVGGLELTTMNNHVGRQIWEFDPNEGSEEEKMKVEEARKDFWCNRFERKNSQDLLMRLQFASGTPLSNPLTESRSKDKECVAEDNVMGCLERAICCLSNLQSDDGHWPGDFGGPIIFMPGLIISLHITRKLKIVLSLQHRKEIMRYFFNHQNEDGGWGLHIESPSTMLASTLVYVALRLLGKSKIDEGSELQKGRKWIIDHGGATYTPLWGKFWLSVLGVYEWSGVNPLPPELWTYPYWIPFHAGRLWCHYRMVYLPMSYLYGKRFVGSVSKKELLLREELYSIPYAEIRWDCARNLCAKEDVYCERVDLCDVLSHFLYRSVEDLMPDGIFRIWRKRAIHKAMQHIHYEDESTHYICIGPMNKVLNMLCCWVEDPFSEEFQLHLPRIHDYLWLAEDGMKMQAYNGSQLWDTTLTVQAIISTKLSEKFGSTLRKAHSYIKNTQIRRNCPGDFSFSYRHISKGAWPFSTADHGWTSSDCTAEGLKASLLLSQISVDIVGEPLEVNWLQNAVNIILSLMNKDGGFATYERTRSWAWLEMFNPTEIFEDVVIDHPYIECTSAAIQALSLFKKLHPKHRREEVETCIAKGAQFIGERQKHDGSWYGSWAICFTYGTWLAIKGLVAAGKNYVDCSSIQRACEFLLSRQLPSGGWGESYISCKNKVYTNLEGRRSHAVNTAWAMLALIEAGQSIGRMNDDLHKLIGKAERNPEPLHRAADVLIDMQLEDGEFPQQEIIGVFNRNCLVNFSAYRNIFPIWALGEYRCRVLLDSKKS